MYNTVWISTTPRTGSMWTYNVVRRLLILSDFNLLPKEVPQSDSDMIANYDVALNDADPANRYCLKVHQILLPGLEKSKIISTIRDPRDICLSFKTFMKCDFERALKAANTIVEYVSHYEKYDPQYLTFVKYEDIEYRPEAAIEKINDFLGLHVEKSDILQLASALSKAKVKKSIAKKHKQLEKKIRLGKPIENKEVVRLSERNFRAFDVSTGFQSGHVSGKKSGAWQEEFSETEQKILEETFGDFCTKFGYR